MSWLTGLALRSMTTLVGWLPDALTHRVFDLAGAGIYLLQPDRRAQVRANLARICGWLVAEGLATPRVASAARGGRALERLVRDAFRHHARYYLEVMRIPSYDRAAIEARLMFLDWPTCQAGLDRIAQGHGLVYLGIHYASMELPAAFAHSASGALALTPMETIADPVLQGWLERQRARVGIEIIDPAGSARRLVAWARDGGVIDLVCDRPLAGASRMTELFGVPASLPVGPALLAVETGVTCQMAVARRTGFGRYELDIRELEAPDASLPRKARVAAFMAAQARAIEALVAPAPEQWWTVMYPIWDDLHAEPATTGQDRSEPATSGHDGSQPATPGEAA